MRGTELLDAMAYLPPEQIEAAERRNRKRAPFLRRISVAAAVLFCLTSTLFFSAWAFLPALNTENAERIVLCRVGDRLAEYAVTDVSRYQDWTMESRKGESLGANIWRIKDAEDLVRVIWDDGQHYPELLRFRSFRAFLDEDSPFFTEGILTEEDRTLLRFGESYPFGEVLETIYGVASWEDIRSVTWEKADFDRSAAGKRVKAETCVLRDEESLIRVYHILKDLVRSSGDAEGPRRVFADDPAYRNGELPLSIQTDRRVTVTLKSGETIRFQYAPGEGMLCENYTVLYDPLNADDNRWLIERIGIDLTWHDWGANASPTGKTASVREP